MNDDETMTNCGLPSPPLTPEPWSPDSWSNYDISPSQYMFPAELFPLKRVYSEDSGRAEEARQKALNVYPVEVTRRRRSIDSDSPHCPAMVQAAFKMCKASNIDLGTATHRKARTEIINLITVVHNFHRSEEAKGENFDGVWKDYPKLEVREDPPQEEFLEELEESSWKIEQEDKNGVEEEKKPSTSKRVIVFDNTRMFVSISDSAFAHFRIRETRLQQQQQQQDHPLKVSHILVS